MRVSRPFNSPAEQHHPHPNPMKKSTSTNTRSAPRGQTRKPASTAKPQAAKPEPSDDSPITWKQAGQLIDFARAFTIAVKARLAELSLELTTEQVKRKRLEQRVALLEKRALNNPDALAAVLDGLGEIRETQTNGFDDLAIAAHWHNLTSTAKLAHLDRIGLSSDDIAGGLN